VWWRDRAVELTAKEFQILDALAARPGRVFSKAQLAAAAWEDDPQDNAIEAHVSHLRRKLAPDLIRTIRGVGYVLETIS
jgi:DNA-binding response OmpR family regulator